MARPQSRVHKINERKFRRVYGYDLGWYINIPKFVMANLKWDGGDEVYFTCVDGKLVIEKWGERDG